MSWFLVKDLSFIPVVVTDVGQDLDKTETEDIYIR